MRNKLTALLQDNKNLETLVKNEAYKGLKEYNLSLR